MVGGTGPSLVDRLDRLIDHRATQALFEAGAKPGSFDGSSVRHDYANWRYRFPLDAKRRVYVSRTLKESPAYAGYAAALAAIERAVEAGENLDRFLSKRTLTAVEPPKRQAKVGLGRRADLDLLLNDWGLHHMHLGPWTPGARFVGRTDDVLCVRFTGDAAYFVDIIKHGQWSELKLLEIMVRTWPTHDLLWGAFEGVRLKEAARTDDELRQLREAGVNTLVEIDGRVYSPGGVTMAGSALEVTRDVVNIYWDLEPWRADTVVKLETEANAPSGGLWLPFIRGTLGGFRAGDYFRPITQRLSFPLPPALSTVDAALWAGALDFPVLGRERCSSPA